MPRALYADHSILGGILISDRSAPTSELLQLRCTRRVCKYMYIYIYIKLDKHIRFQSSFPCLMGCVSKRGACTHRTLPSPVLPTNFKKVKQKLHSSQWVWVPNSWNPSCHLGKMVSTALGLALSDAAGVPIFPLVNIIDRCLGEQLGEELNRRCR